MTSVARAELLGVVSCGSTAPWWAIPLGLLLGVLVLFVAIVLTEPAED